MVSIQEVRHTLAGIKTRRSGLVGVFVGGTNGIGEHTAREFIRYASNPKVYLIGRSAEQADKLKGEFQQLNHDSQVQFIQSDVSLLRNVDQVCNEIQSKEKEINLLVLSAGIMTTKGRDDTTEGLDKKFSLHYYSRLRFAQNLLPLLNNTATSDSKDRASVISVLGAGLENTLNMDDLSLKSSYSLRACATHAITMNTLSFQHLATQNPQVSFIHTQPGGVPGTKLTRELPWVLTTMVNIASATIIRPWVMEAKESGERHLWAGLCADIPSGRVALIGPKGEETGSVGVLEKMKNEGIEDKVWEHSMDVFKKICEQSGKW